MCVVSMIGDHYQYHLPKRYPWIDGQGLPFTNPATALSVVSREEFDALKRDVEEMKEMLKRAKEYDDRNGEPDCEVDEKINLLRKVAKLVGIDLDDALKRET